MQQPLQITFKEMEPSAAIETWVRENATKLEKFYEPIVHCHVVVEAPHRHSHRGRLYDVRIDITVPGGEIVVSHQGPKDQAHEDVYVALRDAFRAARRQLQDVARKQRKEVKSHDLPTHARVTKLFPADDYGFIEGEDALEIYFHRNAVLDDAFDALSVGSVVRYVLAEGEGQAGPQASTVELIGEAR
ncbi:MAG: 30S ribosomal protein S30 [Myxococcales bacterium SG8_38]|nr:MAG: 30S ribosomal protein S30 [Myxococcales bacterium SG8_38]